MSNQQWQQPQPGPGWQPQAPAWQPPGQPPRRNRDKTALIIGAIIIAVALIAAAAFLLTRNGATADPPTPGNSTPAHTPHTPTPSGQAEQFTYDDAPSDINGWIPQPVLEGMTGTYYTNAKVLEADGSSAQIVVGNYDIDFDMAVGSITVTATSSDGRVACGTDEVNDPMCFAQTGRFGVLVISTYDKVIAIPDMVSVSDALVATYP